MIGDRISSNEEELPQPSIVARVIAEELLEAIGLHKAIDVCHQRIQYYYLESVYIQKRIVLGTRGLPRKRELRVKPR